MITTVVFTANSKAGNLARIALAARRLGFRAVKQSKLQSDEQRFDKIKLELEADQPILANQLDRIRSMVPTVIEIESTGSVAGVKVPPRKSATTQRAARTTQSATTTGTSSDFKPLLNTYGKRIVADFPNVAHLIQRFDDEVAPDVRDEAMLKLGQGIGRWQYKKNYSLGAKLPLDKTLQRMLWPALGEMVDIVREGTRILVKNCPHGKQSDSSQHLDCHFVTGFISGFLNELTHFRGVEVSQTHKKNANGHCVFEVRPK